MQIPQSFTRNRPRSPFFCVHKQTHRLMVLALMSLALGSLGTCHSLSRVAERLFVAGPQFPRTQRALEKLWG
jgi:hypothetical protein